MDIEKKIQVIREEILEEARNKKEKKIQQAREKWDQSYQDFKDDLQEREEDIKESYRQKAARHKEQIISRAVLNRKKEKRQQIDQYLNDFLDRLQQRLVEFRDEPDYLEFLQGIIKEAGSILGDSELIVELNQADRQRFADLKRNLEEKTPEIKLSLGDKVLEISGGVVVKEKSGREIVEYTFQNILENYREEIALEIQRQIS